MRVIVRSQKVSNLFYIFLTQVELVGRMRVRVRDMK